MLHVEQEFNPVQCIPFSSLPLPRQSLPEDLQLVLFRSSFGLRRIVTV